MGYMSKTQEMQNIKISEKFNPNFVDLLLFPLKLHAVKL